MANDLSVSSASFSPSVASVSPAVKLRQSSVEIATPGQTLSTSASGILSTSELQRAVQVGEPLSLGDAQVIKTIERANKALEGRSTTFEFSVHKDTSLISIKVLDKDTGEVIREIPPDKTLDMVKKMWELAGMLVDERR